MAKRNKVALKAENENEVQTPEQQEEQTPETPQEPTQPEEPQQPEQPEQPTGGDQPPAEEPQAGEEEEEKPKRFFETFKSCKSGYCVNVLRRRRRALNS